MRTRSGHPQTPAPLVSGSRFPLVSKCPAGCLSHLCSGLKYRDVHRGWTPARPPAVAQGAVGTAGGRLALPGAQENGGLGWWASSAEGDGHRGAGASKQAPATSRCPPGRHHWHPVRPGTSRQGGHHPSFVSKHLLQALLPRMVTLHQSPRDSGAIPPANPALPLDGGNRFQREGGPE